MPIRYITRWTKTKDCFRVSVFEARRRVGAVTACEAFYQAAGGMVMQINAIEVLPEHQRQRVGTRPVRACGQECLRAWPGPRIVA